MYWIDFLFRLLAAIGLGAIVGLERQIAGHATGIRTCVLVCVGSCLFTCFPYCILEGDVIRAAMQIISGVGFLGSGIIFKDDSSVRGLNTAATIWCTAGIGVFTGAGFYIFALLASVCLLIVNIIFRLLNRVSFLWGRFYDAGTVYRFSVCCTVQEANAVRSELFSLLKNKQSYVFYFNKKQKSGVTVQLVTKFFHEDRMESDIIEHIIGALSDFTTIHEVEWEKVG